MRTFTARVVVVCAAASAFVPLQRCNRRALTQRAAPRDDGVRSRKDWQAVGAAPAIIRAAKLCGAGGGPTRIQAAGYAAVAACVVTKRRDAFSLSAAWSGAAPEHLSEILAESD